MSLKFPVSLKTLVDEPVDDAKVPYHVVRARLYEAAGH